MTERLLVKNLPARMGARELVELLSPICEATVLSGPAGQRRRRQALIEVAHHEDAARIMAGFDGRVVDNRRVNFEWTRGRYPALPPELESEVGMAPPPEPRPPPRRPRRPERSPGR